MGLSDAVILSSKVSIYLPALFDVEAANSSSSLPSPHRGSLCFDVDSRNLDSIKCALFNELCIWLCFYLVLRTGFGFSA